VQVRAWQAIGGITAISVAVTLAQLPASTWMSTGALSLSMGVAAMSLMAATALLASRWSVIENAFGGLDRVYLAHKWMAIAALVFASIHFVFKAGAPGWETASIVTLPSSWTRLVRQLALIALMVIVILALNRKIPYHRWRWWHKLSGPLFAIVVLHWLSFKSPIALSSAAGIWLATLSGVGLLAAAYKLVLYPFVAPHAEYRVVRAVPGAAALHLELEPVKHPVSFEAGQFAFISVKEDGLREPHPFTIARAPDEKGHVHFVIRDLGDYTHKLIRRIAVGMHATVYAPFGRFRRVPTKREIWIAGGVGISPFLAWLTDEQPPPLDNVTLFYFFTPGREFPSAERIEELARRRNAEFVPVPDGPTSETFKKRFEALVRESGSQDLIVSCCGPKGLLEHVRGRMREHGLPDGCLRFEHFELR
jgi:predicted ferric reductase